MEGGQFDKMEVGAIIQARMESTRLPGKVLLPMPTQESDSSILSCIIKGINRSERVDDIIIATSLSPSNDRIIQFCKERGIKYFRGDEEDVLSRFQAIQQEYNFDLIVRLTGDNPFVDGTTLDTVIIEHLQKDYDYSYSLGLPLGMNFEIIKAELISYKGISLTHSDREHVTPPFRNNPKFKNGEIRLFENTELTSCRLTVDYLHDYLLCSAVASWLNWDIPLINQIANMINKMPWLFETPAHLVQKKVKTDPKQQVQEARKLLDFYGFTDVDARINESQVNE